MGHCICNPNAEDELLQLAVQASLECSEQLRVREHKMQKCLEQLGKEQEIIDGDGNCLFEALARSCGSTHTELRNRVVNHLVKTEGVTLASGMTRMQEIRFQFEEEQGWQDFKDEGLLNAYKAYMIKDKVYGTALELAAIVRELHPELGHATVYQLDKSGNFIEAVVGDPSLGNGVELAYVRGNHYNLVHKITSATGDAVVARPSALPLNALGAAEAAAVAGMLPARATGVAAPVVRSSAGATAVARDVATTVSRAPGPLSATAPVKRVSCCLCCMSVELLVFGMLFTQELKIALKLAARKAERQIHGGPTIQERLAFV